MVHENPSELVDRHVHQTSRGRIAIQVRAANRIGNVIAFTKRAAHGGDTRKIVAVLDKA